LDDPVRSVTLRVRTGTRDSVVDITGEVERFVREAGADGLCHVFVPHATAGLALLELRSGSEHDLLSVLDRILPADRDWRHAHGSVGHGRAHVLPALVSPFLVLPVVDGRLALGTWQSVALVDLNVDNPDRTVRLSFVRAPAEPAPGSGDGDGRPE
jgi:secondary thiamine-phosphate synthase enzyme